MSQLSLKFKQNQSSTSAINNKESSQIMDSSARQVKNMHIIINFKFRKIEKITIP